MTLLAIEVMLALVGAPVLETNGTPILHRSGVALSTTRAMSMDGTPTHPGATEVTIPQIAAATITDGRRITRMPRIAAKAAETLGLMAKETVKTMVGMEAILGAMTKEMLRPTAKTEVMPGETARIMLRTVPGMEEIRGLTKTILKMEAGAALKVMPRITKLAPGMASMEAIGRTAKTIAGIEKFPGTTTKLIGRMDATGAMANSTPRAVDRIESIHGTITKPIRKTVARTGSTTKDTRRITTRTALICLRAWLSTLMFGRIANITPRMEATGAITKALLSQMSRTQGIGSGSKVILNQATRELPSLPCI